MTVQTYTVDIGVNDWYPGVDVWRYFPPPGTNMVPNPLSTSITITITSVTSTTGGFTDLNFYDQHGSIVLDLGAAGPGSSGTVSWLSLTNGYLRAEYRGGINDTNNSFVIEVNDHAGPPSFCAYGTERQSWTTSNFLYYLTPGLIAEILATKGFSGGVASAVFAALWFTWFDVGALCSILPPAWPGLTAADIFPPNITKLRQAFAYVAWDYFCQCKPATGGDPAPTPPDTGGGSMPTGVQEPQPFLCDQVDVCAMLNQLALAVGNINAIIGQNLSLTTLIQRQKVPFAYVPGALHSGLTASGELSVQGLLGVAVQVTTVPGASGLEAGDPALRWKLGRINTGTPDGWRKSAWIDTNPQWVDLEPDDTLIGYSLEPLVVANIQEYKREP